MLGEQMGCERGGKTRRDKGKKRRANQKLLGILLRERKWRELSLGLAAVNHKSLRMIGLPRRAIGNQSLKHGK